MDRRALLIARIDVNGCGLEIQPGCIPVLPKSAGFRVETIDFVEAAAFCNRHHDTPDCDDGGREAVDYMVTGGSMVDTIGKSAAFDYIVASLVVHNRPDFLGFLKECEALLKPDGVLFLEVPDKRYWSDVLHPPSSTGAILQAHFDRRKRPGLGAIFDDRAYNILPVDRYDETCAAGGPLQFALEMDCVRMLYADERRSQRYIPVSVWKFVPSSFRLIINDLNEIGEINLCEQEFIGGEATFFMILSRLPKRRALDRVVLLRQAWAEQAETF